MKETNTINRKKDEDVVSRRICFDHQSVFAHHNALAKPVNSNRQRDRVMMRRRCGGGGGGGEWEIQGRKRNQHRHTDTMEEEEKKEEEEEEGARAPSTLLPSQRTDQA